MAQAAKRTPRYPDASRHLICPCRTAPSATTRKASPQGRGETLLALQQRTAEAKPRGVKSTQASKQARQRSRAGVRLAVSRYCRASAARKERTDAPADADRPDRRGSGTRIHDNTSQSNRMQTRLSSLTRTPLVPLHTRSLTLLPSRRYRGTTPGVCEHTPTHS